MTMIEGLQSIYHRIIAWWRPQNLEIDIGEGADRAVGGVGPSHGARAKTESDGRTVPSPMSKAMPRFDEDSGEFYFREMILDQLDDYFSCISRMRNHDKDAFDLYSRIGGQIMPRPLMDDSDLDVVGLEASPWFTHALPDFGAVFNGDRAKRAKTEWDAKHKDDPKLWPHFYYFRRYKHEHAPSEIEPGHGDAVYVLSVYWVHDKYGDAPTEFAIALNRSTGQLRLLRRFTTETFYIRHKNRYGHRRHDRVTAVERPVWRKADPFLKDWSAEHKIKPEPFITRLFCYATILFELGNASMIRVSVNKGDLTAAFSVNIKRTPYFFKDRELTVNQRGRRKRIFHIVRPHVRASGKAVKLHFRGERKFDWRGYNVVITVPGVHHYDFSEFSVGMIDDDGSNKNRRLITTETLARRIRNNIQAGAQLLGRRAETEQPRSEWMP